MADVGAARKSVGAGHAGEVFFTAAVKDHAIVIQPATQAAYWGTVASRIDPDPAARQDSQKLVDMLYTQSPGLKPKVDELLAKSSPPVN